MDNSDSQEMEILALQNIFESKDFSVESMNPPSGRFVAYVRLPENFTVKQKLHRAVCDVDNEGNEAHLDEKLVIEHLPPINLFFHFPSTYPQETCPAFLLSCNWLTLHQLSKLCKHLEYLWEVSQDVVLYTWLQFLQDEALEFLEISNSLDVTELTQFRAQRHFYQGKKRDEAVFGKESLLEEDSDCTGIAIKPSVSGGNGDIDIRAVNDMHDGKKLLSVLKTFNKQKKEDIYNHSSHICDICFLAREGLEFVSFATCGHSFCKECIKSYFEVQIKDGNVNSLLCPEDKCSTQADGSLVRKVVSQDLFEKYDTLLLSRTLDGMSDIMFCPRRECQHPVLLETCGTLGRCLACEFVFCALCNMAYHGIAPCNFKTEQRKVIFDSYTTGDSSTREKLEKQYGKRIVKQLVENIMSENWKDSNSKPCPHCNASIEKTEGCNKMTCSKCGAFFCWICSRTLPSANPYSHFNSKDCQLFPDDHIDNEFDVQPGDYLDFMF